MIDILFPNPAVQNVADAHVVVGAIGSCEEEIGGGPVGAVGG